MKINRNMSAVMTNNQLLRTEDKLSASMQRLSSGLKINKPGDNPSGMAISNKMRAQIKALDQDEDNIADAISVMQIADGALNETTSILQRIRELSVQAANGTNSQSDKESIQAEIDQLVQEVDRISTDTEYNEKTLLDGSSDTRVYAKTYEDDGTGNLVQKAVRKDISRINISDDVPVGNYDFEIDAVAKYATTSMPLPADINEDTTLLINGQACNLRAGMDDNDYVEEIRKAAEAGGCSIDATYDATGKLTGLDVIQNHPGSIEEISIEYEQHGTGSLTLQGSIIGDNGVAGAVTVDGIEVDLSDVGSVAAAQTKINNELAAQGSTSTVAIDAQGHVTINGTGSVSGTLKQLYSGTDAEISLDLGNTFNTTATYHAEGNRIYITDQNGFSIDFMIEDAAKTGDRVEIEVTDVGRMIIQVGANEYQTVNVRIPETSAETLYLDTVNVVEYNGAERAMRTLDDAIDYVNSVRARIGAYQNRLEYAENSTSATNENMTNAYSTLLDTDMAEEMTEYTQQNVLEQASISVLSQANELPQQVLSLLS